MLQSAESVREDPRSPFAFPWATPKGRKVASIATSPVATPGKSLAAALDEAADDGDDSMAFFKKRTDRAAPADAPGGPHSRHITNWCYATGTLAVLVEHFGFGETEAHPDGAMWVFRSLFSAGFAMRMFWLFAGLGDLRNRRAGKTAQALGDRLGPLARLYFAMVVLDALKKMVWGSFEVVGICLGGCGLRGSMNFVNLTRTKWFIISLAWCRLVGFFAERKLAPRAAERWLPLAVAALHVFLRFVDVYENGDAYYSTKVGQLKPLNYFVKSAYYYVVWPLLMPRNLGTLRCSARSAKREDVLFARPPCVPARRHRVQPAGAADPPPADVIAVGAATAARWSAGVLLANVVVVTCVARTAQRPKTLDGPRRTLDTGLLPTLFQLASCSLNSGCLVAFPLARATRRLGGLGGGARVAYLLFDETVAAAILGSYVYWCPATPTFFSDLGAKALFGYIGA